MPVMNTLQLPFNGDANNFLKLIAYTLDSNGGLVNINSNTLSIMESCKLMVDRCMIMHAMRATKEEDLKLLLSGGAWDELFFWLRESRSGANVCMLMELLQLYKMLPINTQLLRQNSCAKEIKQLIKFPDDRVSRLAKVVVSDWMQKVAGVPITSLKSGSKLTNKTDPTKITPKDIDHILSDQNNHLTDKNLLVESSQRLDSKIDIQTSKRPRTVKSLGLRMRSTGLEGPIPSASAEIKTSNQSNKNNFANSTSNSLQKPQLPKITTKTKTIPANSLFSDFTSHGFLNALASTEPTNLLKRKRKLSQISPINNLNNNIPNFPKDVVEKKSVDNGVIEEKSGEESSQLTLLTNLIPKSDVQSNSFDKIDEDSAPFTLSFYREQERENYSDENGKISPTEQDTNILLESTDFPVNSEPASKKVKKKRNVSWADDFNLCTYFYFQINKDERVNVSKYGGFEEGRKHEQEMERKMFQRHPSAVSTLPSTILKMPWRNPPILDGLEQLVVPGCNSKEHIIQKEREARVLQVIYFQREYIPESPSEPDMDYMLMNDDVECKNIPLFDITDPTACPPVAIETVQNNFVNQATCLPPALSNLLGPIQQQDSFNMNNSNGFLYANPQPTIFPPFVTPQHTQFTTPNTPNFPIPTNTWTAPVWQQFNDRPICRHFLNTGRCRFGATCRFTHPA